MRIANGTCILVTDGSKMLLLRNEGDADYPKLARLAKAEDDNPSDHAQKSDDGPGRMAAMAAGGRRSAYQEVDFHRQEEERFARRTADLLGRRAAAGEFERMVVVADPRTLGVLRDHYPPALKRAVTAEVAKDLVKHPVAEIERILCEHN
jgi:protein required for attachment to host cells